VTAVIEKRDSSPALLDDHSVLGRAARILDGFGDRSPVLSLNQLSERTGLPKSTSYRFAEQLVALGWLERASCGYRVGMRLFELGGLAAGQNRLREVALPELQHLAVAMNYAAHLAILDDGEVLYLNKVRAKGLELPTREGGRMPAHCTALGKALLAFAGEGEVERVVRRGLGSLTPQSIVTPDRLRAHLEGVKRTGVAIDCEEASPGICCVAVPVRGSGRAIAAISLTGPSEGFDAPSAAKMLKRVAATIWSEMFHTRPATYAQAV
jgi:DNA-binding IclR family transcriptional regulator